MKRSGAKPTVEPTPSTQPVQLVRMEYTNAEAQSVCVAGSFNDWHPSVTEMIPLGQGRWAKEMVLPPGRYEYRLVVDGRWIQDPSAAEAAANPFGGANSVLRVP